MKRKISLLLSLVMLLSLLSACKQPPVTESDPLPSTAVDGPSAQELANAVLPCSGYDKALETEVLDADAVSVYLENAYGLGEGACTDAAIIRGAGMSAFEITVLRLSNEDAATDGADRLKDYLHTREVDFTGYAPAEADMAANGHIRQEGAWLGLFICPDPVGAEDAFRQALHGVVIPKVLPDSVTDMKSLKDAVIYQCRDELTELGGYRVSMFGSTEDFPQQMEDTYGVPASQLVDGFVIHGPEGSFFEVTVLRMADQKAADQCFMDDLLSTYVDSVTEPFFTLDEDGVRNIEDEDLELYKYITRNSRIQNGEFLALLICEDPQGTTRQLRTAITSLHQSEKSQTVSTPEPELSLNPEGVPIFMETNWKPPEGEPDPNHPGRLKFTSPNEEDMSIYNTSAILSAWAASDPSPLSGYDRKIYDAAKAVLDEVLTDDMSDYDKEVAIYAWVVKNVDYDHSSTDVLAETKRDAYGPYGGLVNHATVCLGYSTTFQLLADLAGLECITVVGAGSSSEADHAWNMVRLDGNWYCLDATWDANAREQGLYPSGWVWRFFNVTSDYMARTNHQWDYDNVPEAVTGGHGQS